MCSFPVVRLQTYFIMRFLSFSESPCNDTLNQTGSGAGLVPTDAFRACSWMTFRVWSITARRQNASGLRGWAKISLQQNVWGASPGEFDLSLLWDVVWLKHTEVIRQLGGERKKKVVSALVGRQREGLMTAVAWQQGPMWDWIRSQFDICNTTAVGRGENSLREGGERGEVRTENGSSIERWRAIPAKSGIVRSTNSEDLMD